MTVKRQVMKVVVMTSDHYLKALRPFSYLFQKYWHEKQCVDVVGFAHPDFDLPGNFTFTSLGDQSNYPVGKWSNALIDYLESIEDSHFILFLEDYWLTRPVNLEAIHMLWDYAHQFKYVLKVDLCADRLYASGMTDYGHCGYLDLIRSDPASQYHMSLYLGIWNKNLMLNFLRPNETPWQVELSGTPRVAAAADSVLVLGTRQLPAHIMLAHRRGNPNELLLDGLNDSDIQKLHELGYI